MTDKSAEDYLEIFNNVEEAYQKLHNEKEEMPLKVANTFFHQAKGTLMHNTDAGQAIAYYPDNGHIWFYVYKLQPRIEQPEDELEDYIAVEQISFNLPAEPGTITTLNQVIQTASLQADQNNAKNKNIQQDIDPSYIG